MIRNRAAPSRATPQTLCQKCLKRGHFSYECKAAAQERPYASRPSRTQQLANPKLLPKLSSDTPNDLARKKGVADELLAAKSADRHRARSASASSFSSVSTVSTNRSRHASPRRVSSPHRRSPPPHAMSADHTTRPQQAWRSPPRPSSHAGRKRRRSSFSSSSSSSARSASPSSHSDAAQTRQQRRDRDARNQRRRRSSVSPAFRGRPRHSSSLSRVDEDGVSRSRSSSRSPYRRGRGRQRSRSRADSMDRGGIARHRTPLEQDGDGRADGPANGDRYERNGKLREPRNGYDRGRGYPRRENERGGRAGPPPPPPPPPPPKERSLSPYSRRLMLTQAMGMG